MMTDPALILLDEPFNGINPALIEGLIAMVRKHNKDGKTFLLISHEMPHVSELCGHASVLAARTNVPRSKPDAQRKNTPVLESTEESRIRQEGERPGRLERM